MRSPCLMTPPSAAMSNHRTTHPRNLHLSICLLLVLFSQSYAAIVGREQCSENEYRNDQGFCCDKCHAGFKLTQKCSAPGQRSVCDKCNAGTYMNNANFHNNCFTCKKCKKPNMVIVSDCTVTRDTQCQCTDGYYMKDLGGSTLECFACKKCGPGQLKNGNCTGDDYNHCKCKENHWRVKPNSCEPCDKCQDHLCYHLCNFNITTNTVQKPSTYTVSEIAIPVGACIMTLAVGVFMLYEAIRLWRKRKRALSAQQSTSHDHVAKTEVEVMVSAVSPDTVQEILITNQLCETELPDCVPREIKVHEFIYFVLDEIPVVRFKELVRRLGISEQDIDRAERDNRSFKDAQYQMLKIWSDRGSGGGNNILPCHLIQLFIDTLRDMYLANCADYIENKVLSQDRKI